MEKVEYKTISVKALKEDGVLYIEGYAAAFGNVDAYRDIILKGAFAQTIQDFSRMRILVQHDDDKVVGKILEMKEDDSGLWFRGMISKAEGDLAIKIEEGLYDEMSIGYRTKLSEYDSVQDIRYLKQIELFEVSVVFYAANPQAKITHAERKDILTDEELKEALDHVYERKRDLEREMIKRAIKAAFKNA